MNIEQFWKAVLAQDRDAIREYFRDEAFVNWHCTNEHFTVDEFIKAKSGIQQPQVACRKCGS